MSLPTIASATFHTCSRLSSAAEQSTQGSLRFQLKSDMRFVCPPCTNNLNGKKVEVSKREPKGEAKHRKGTYSSGGPSWASSWVCSSPARLRSQNMIRLS